MKRLLLFLGTHMAIVLVLFASMKLLGVEPHLNASGLDLTSLLIFAAVMGFGGSIISLAISKWSVNKSMGVPVIETPTDPTEASIKLPELGLYDAPEVNAFAAGISKNSSLIDFGIAGGGGGGIKRLFTAQPTLEERIAARKPAL